MRDIADAAPPWHALPAEEALARLGGNPETGLAEAEAASRRERSTPGDDASSRRDTVHRPRG